MCSTSSDFGSTPGSRLPRILQLTPEKQKDFVVNADKALSESTAPVEAIKRSQRKVSQLQINALIETRISVVQ
jgi:hypothetical protein